ncbi:MAG TPA: type II secretion system protein [Burkholderiaceae bacterium]|nr:type II secretion system protein [Burkholderiaceae bacterium]
MNKQAMHTARQSAQAGFTLIELIVVIVILGILAATALPKFASLGGDARKAALSAAQGALATEVAMVHGQSLLKPSDTTVTNEGVKMNVVFGYPEGKKATTGAAAGLTDADYTMTDNPAASDTAVDSTNNVPAIPANGFVVVPKGLAGTAAALKCYISYKQATSTSTPAVIQKVDDTCQ